MLNGYPPEYAIQERDYQLPLFKDDIEVKNDRINDMQKLSI